MSLLYMGRHSCEKVRNRISRNLPSGHFTIFKTYDIPNMKPEEIEIAQWVLVFPEKANQNNETGIRIVPNIAG
jgi:hypothetical protein